MHTLKDMRIYWHGSAVWVRLRVSPWSHWWDGWGASKNLITCVIRDMQYRELNGDVEPIL